VIFYAQETTTKQISGNAANLNMGKWDKTLDVVAGTYDCWAYLYTVNKQTGKINKTQSTTKQGIVVK
jgi:hypothetical protein